MNLDTKLIYSHNKKNTSYAGHQILKHFDNYISERVNLRYYDSEGNRQLKTIFDDFIGTGFDDSLLKIINTNSDKISWRIGETLVECYLEDFCNARFPYNYSRDAKNPKSNLQGADIVGLVSIDSESLFLFGEIKTSSEVSCPPKVIYGKNGLISQLKNLITEENTRLNLIRWLGFKVSSLDESHQDRKNYKAASEVYLNSNSEKMKVIGVLLRDIQPNEDDIKIVFQKTSICLRESTKLELLTLYLPVKIEELETLIGDNKLVT